MHNAINNPTRLKKRWHPGLSPLGGSYGSHCADFIPPESKDSAERVKLDEKQHRDSEGDENRVIKWY